ncbi:MAG: 16S rRNA (adenine(1518)-N(6)/adenine(1519)-N(6))-dimethyltransferase RsmA [Oscillospiraceae bacterium]
MQQLTNIGTIKLLCDKYGFNFSKSLGQNFIINPSVCPKMVDMSNINKDYAVIEIGTGFGVLTKELAEKSSKVIAIEIDKKLLPVLDETLAEYNNIEIINDDILKVNLKKIIEEKCKGLKVCVCANLPYYITSPIIMNILEQKLDIEFITAMVQKEAGDRLVADFKSKSVGAITFGVRYYGNPKILFKVSKGSFMPSPKVESCVINISIIKDNILNEKQEKLMFKLIKMCFIQRRKTILNSLSNGLKLDKSIILNFLEKSNINEKERPERLNLKDFNKLSEVILKYKEVL